MKIEIGRRKMSDISCFVSPENQAALLNTNMPEIKTNVTFVERLHSQIKFHSPYVPLSLFWRKRTF